MAKGGGSSQPQKQEVTQTNIPEYARPYYEGLMQRASTALTTPYQTYDQERIAGFTPQQQQVQQNIMGMQTPGQFGTATNLTSAAGLGSLAASQYAPSNFNAQQVSAQTYNAPTMQAAQSQYRPELSYFQMAAPQQFGGQQASQYMSPYAQNVMDVQKREAVRDAQKGQVVQDLGAARQGTYGGSRQLLAGLERERNLGTQLGDIQAKGQQSAYENAQQQFERDRAAQQSAQQANLQAQLGVQQLGSGQQMQVALANLDAESQGRVQNLAAQLQTQGLNADQAMRTAMANQQANLDAQRASEQSRQFGAQQGLAGLAQAGQMGQTLSNIGSASQQAEAQRLGLQQGTAAQQQALNQQYLDTSYQDFLRQQGYPAEQLQQYSSLLRGVPVTPNQTTSTYQQQPGVAQQLLGAGLGGLGMYNTLKG